MMKRYLPIDTCIEDIIDWGNYKGRLDRVAMKKLANSILRKLEIQDDFIEKIVMLDVKDHKAILPEDMQSVIQMAFHNEVERKVKRMEIVEWTQKTYDGSKCEFTITKDCPKCGPDPETPCSCNDSAVVFKVDRQWELNHPEYRYNHMKHYYRHGGINGENQVTSMYHPDFVLMKPSTHHFFNADQHIPGCLNLNTRLLSNINIEYKLDYPIVNVNKKEGKILLSYLAARVDKEGYRMIPDIEDVFEAIKWFIIESLEYKSIGKATTQYDRNHHKSMTKEARALKIEAMGRAYEIVSNPDFSTWWDFLEQNHFKVLKDLNKENYYGVKTPDQYGQMMGRLTDHR